MAFRGSKTGIQPNPKILKSTCRNPQTTVKITEMKAEQEFSEIERASSNHLQENRKTELMIARMILKIIKMEVELPFSLLPLVPLISKQ